MCKTNQERRPSIEMLQIHQGLAKTLSFVLDVEKQGAILNNSYVTSKTKLAGYVQGNSNMVNGTAKVIVNQVTSDTPTSMNGYLEVAGQKASVVVANPNGITVNGGGFLNTEHVVLTTGRPELDGAGHLQNYRVEQGKVSVEIYINSSCQNRHRICTFPIKAFTFNRDFALFYRFRGFNG